MSLKEVDRYLKKWVFQSSSFIILCMYLALSPWSASYSLAQNEKPSVPPPEMSMEERWGVKPLTVRITAEGFFVDFRYRIVDADKAAPLFGPNIKPLLIDENTGAIMAVPTVPKVGSMRSTRKPLTGREYAILFANPNKHIKPGHKVTVAIGDYKAEHLVVEGEESSSTESKQALIAGNTEGITDPNRPIIAQKGQHFAIVLDSNRTTGYRWELATTPDRKLIDLVGSRYEVADTQRIGSGGREIWTFTATSSGTTKIEFQYKRPWEEKTEPIKTVSFRVEVQ